MRNKEKAGQGKYKDHFSRGDVELHGDHCQGLSGEAKTSFHQTLYAQMRYLA